MSKPSLTRGSTMTNANTQDTGRAIPWRIIGWSIPPLVLLLPLVAGAPWTLFDYIVMGVLLGGAGLLVELVVRASGNIAYRAAAFIAIAAIFLLIWVNGAVGFLGDEDNPANLMFGGVILVAVVGSVFLGFQPRGMARAMFAAAAAQLLVGVVGPVDRRRLHHSAERPPPRGRLLRARRKQSPEHYRTGRARHLRRLRGGVPGAVQRRAHRALASSSAALRNRPAETSHIEPNNVVPITTSYSPAAPGDAKPPASPTTPTSNCAAAAANIARAIPLG